MSNNKSQGETAVVIGAGVIGCAVAQRLASNGYSVFILEAGPRIAEGVTSRNSGVIHAGLYYPPSSLKAQACIRGSALLYEWCEAHGVPHKKTGKWVVAASDEKAELESTFENARASGANDLEWHPSISIPGVKSTIGLWSPNTGIVDQYEFTKSLLTDAESKGAECFTNTEVQAIDGRERGRYILQTNRGEIPADVIVNCAGLNSDAVARLADINKYKLHYWRGDYFTWKPRIGLENTKFDYLIYPVKKKNAPGLGVHLTLSLDGRMKFGPDVKLADSKDDVGEPKNLEALKNEFYIAASKYLSNVSIEDLQYDSCGIRPKLRSPTDTTEKDFIISQDLTGFVNLIGIESPGLTASLDIADLTLKHLV